MKEIISYLTSHWQIACALLAAVIVVAVAVTAIVLVRKKKKQADTAEAPLADITIPQETAHTLMTNTTLKLVRETDNSAFAVEHEITFVSTDEVV